MTRTPSAPKLAAKHTPGPWSVERPMGFELTIVEAGKPTYEWRFIASCDLPDEKGNDFTPEEDFTREEVEANARLIAAAPDHALICWAMCVQVGTWEEWQPFDGKGEFCFAGLRHATALDEFGCPKLTPALREAISASRAKSIELAEAQR